MTSSITNHRYENGRRYHAFREGSQYRATGLSWGQGSRFAGYAFPNDDVENHRLDIHDHMVALVLGGKLHLAPIGDRLEKVLDLGTGTGCWAIDMGMYRPCLDVISGASRLAHRT